MHEWPDSAPRSLRRRLRVHLLLQARQKRSVNPPSKRRYRTVHLKGPSLQGCPAGNSVQADINYPSVSTRRREGVRDSRCLPKLA